MKEYRLIRKRDGFGSSFGLLVALVGSAVGLGNIWRFPYMVGENGGAAFIVIYLFCAFFLAMPIMLGEFVIGRRAGTNAVEAFDKLAPGTKWKVTGLIGVFTAFIMLSFYSVIGGWTLNYLIISLSPSFINAANDSNDFGRIFGEFVSSTYGSIIFTWLFLLITAIIVSRGIKGGIEKSSKIMMPVLFALVVVVAVRSMMLPGAAKGLEYIFKPDFSLVTPDTVLSALGQAFFSLSVGMCCVLTYASYAGKKENILSCSFFTVAADTLFAIIAGCAIMPAVFAFGLNPGEGPGMAFITLPTLFSQMRFGGVIAVIFFFALLLAAVSSAISLQELMISHMMDRFGLSRRKTVLINTACLMAGSTLCALSQGEGLLSGVKILGMDFLSLFDYLTANVFMIIGAILIVIFVGWKMGRDTYEVELTNGGEIKIPSVLLKVSFFFIKYIAPAVILVIAVYSIFR